MVAFNRCMFIIQYRFDYDDGYNGVVEWPLIRALMLSRLIAKKTGVRPIGVGEVLCRMGKVMVYCVYGS